MTTSRCPRSRSTRRDPLPHALRFVRHRPWLFRFGALRLRCGLVVILGRLSKCYFFFLAFPSAVCGVGALGCARGAGALGRIIRVHINTLPPLQGSRRRRPQPCAPALLAEDYNSTLATMEDNAEVRPHPTVRCHPPPASPHSSRLARKPGSRLRTGAVLVTVASSRSNGSSDGKMLFLHPLALRVTLEEGRPPKKHDPHPIPYPSYLTTRRLTGYPGRQWVSGYPVSKRQRSCSNPASG